MPSDIMEVTYSLGNGIKYVIISRAMSFFFFPKKYKTEA